MIRYTVHFRLDERRFSIDLCGSKKWSIRKVEESARICLLARGYSVEDCIRSVVISIVF